MSRETRQLLATVLLAVIALWVLGRVRYPDRPATPNPVPALLTQLGPRFSLDELAAESTRLRTRLGETILPVHAGGTTVSAIRINDDTAVALLPAGRGAHRSPNDAARALTEGATEGTTASSEPHVIASDAATGLAVLRVDAAASAPLAIWAPQALDEPRFLLATVASADAVALRPSFIAALEPMTTAAWSAPIWAIPPAPDLQPGSLVFTADAELAGLVVTHAGGLAIVPGATLLGDAQRVRQLPARTPGFLGIEVQPLTGPLAAATGARTGVVVAWVDPAGSAAGQLMPGDAIEAVDGRWLESREHWEVRTTRLAAGEPIVLGVRRQGEWRDVQLLAAPSVAPLPLGLTLRRVTSVGSAVLQVTRPSAADSAGLEPGDVITLAGTYNAPTPAQIRDAFDAAGGRPLLMAFSRGTSSRIVTVHP